jgi:glycosyltransferase involved in cell wall biosynthesis
VGGRVVFAPFLSDEELRALYQGSEAVLYPTLYEGFGFPAIEAQAAGVPVIFSPVSSLAELVGPLAILADSLDLEGWVRALRRALSLNERKSALTRGAKDWASSFSWQRSFSDHIEVYRRVVNDAKAKSP